MNYVLIILVGIAVLVLIWLLIKKNQKDQKNLEKTIHATEMKPEKHTEDEV